MNQDNNYNFDPLTGQSLTPQQPNNLEPMQPQMQNMNVEEHIQQPINNQQISQQPMQPQMQNMNVQQQLNQTVNNPQLQMQQTQPPNINVQQPMQQQGLPEKTKKIKPILLILILFIIIGIIVGIIIFLNKDKNNAINTPIEEQENINEKQTLTIATIGHNESSAILVSQLTKLYGNYKTVEEINNTIQISKNGVTFNGSIVEYKTSNKNYTHYIIPQQSDYFKAFESNKIKLDGVIMVVSAVDGPSPQTSEQLKLLKENKVTNIVVYMSNCDLVDDNNLLELMEIEVHEIIESFGFDKDKISIIKGYDSKITSGDEKAETYIHDLINSMDKWPVKINSNAESSNENIEINNTSNNQESTNKPFLMAIEDVFEITGKGTVVTGKVERGVIKTGDEIQILGLDKEISTIINDIEIFRKSVKEAKEDDTVGIILKDVKSEEVERGQVLVKPNSVVAAKKFDAEVHILSKEEGGIQNSFFDGYRPQFYFRTIDITGIVDLPDNIEVVNPGDDISFTTTLTSSVAMEEGLKFNIREGGRTVGIGTVTKIYTE